MRLWLGLLFCGALLFAELSTGLRNRGTWGPSVRGMYGQTAAYSNPLTNGLVFFCSFRRVSGSTSFGGPMLLNQPDNGLIENGTGLSVTTTPWGFGVQGFAHGVGNLIFDSLTYGNNVLPQGSAARTGAVLFRVTNTTATTYKPLLIMGNCGGTTSGFLMAVDTTTNHVEAGDVGGLTTITWTPDTNWHLAVGSLSAGTTNAFGTKTFLDGTFVNTGTIGSDSTFNTGTNLFVGDAPSACTGTATNMIIAGVWIWNRGLSLYESQLLWLDPFGMLYDPAFRVAQPAAGSASHPPVYIIQP